MINGINFPVISICANHVDKKKLKSIETTFINSGYITHIVGNNFKHPLWRSKDNYQICISDALLIIDDSKDSLVDDYVQFANEYEIIVLHLKDCNDMYKITKFILCYKYLNKHEDLLYDGFYTRIIMLGIMDHPTPEELVGSPHFGNIPEYLINTKNNLKLLKTMKPHEILDDVLNDMMVFEEENKLFDGGENKFLEYCKGVFI